MLSVVGNLAELSLVTVYYANFHAFMICLSSPSLMRKLSDLLDAGRVRLAMEVQAPLRELRYTRPWSLVIQVMGIPIG